MFAHCCKLLEIICTTTVANMLLYNFCLGYMFLGASHHLFLSLWVYYVHLYWFPCLDLFMGLNVASFAFGFVDILCYLVIFLLFLGLWLDTWFRPCTFTLWPLVACSSYAHCFYRFVLALLTM